MNIFGSYFLSRDFPVVTKNKTKKPSTLTMSSTPPPSPPRPACSDAQIKKSIEKQFIDMFMKVFAQVTTNQLQRPRTVLDPTAVATIVDEYAAQRRQQQQQPKQKRKYYDYKREIARQNIHDDFFHPEHPTFSDKHFERFFRVTRTIAERIVGICMRGDDFFKDSEDALHRQSICPYVKVLLCLKVLAFGVSPVAFIPYFRMGPSTATLCLQKFTKVFLANDDIKKEYLSPPTIDDCHKLSELHLEKHGIPGMMGSIDCMHVGWKNCPVAWQGQFKNGKQSMPTIVLEAAADYNLRIWHTSFGHPGTMNDRTIWDQSSLFLSFLDGTFPDFSFSIAGEELHHLWYLVDGIYPEASRFVLSVKQPNDPVAASYAKWQEGARKDVERAFGVLQRKFQVLRKPLENWFLEDIADIVLSCIVLHNMMVEHRIAREEEDNEGLYDAPNTTVEDTTTPDHTIADRHPTVAAHALPEFDGNEANLLAQRQMELNGEDWFDRHNQEIRDRWSQFYDGNEHFRLREAIKRELQSRRYGY